MEPIRVLVEGFLRGRYGFEEGRAWWVLAPATLGGVLVVVIFLIAHTHAQYSSYDQTTGIFPQVVSCVDQHPSRDATATPWKPILTVKVEPNRDPGRVREYRVLGCSLYYYHDHF